MTLVKNSKRKSIADPIAFGVVAAKWDQWKIERLKVTMEDLWNELHALAGDEGTMNMKGERFLVCMQEAYDWG